MIVMNVFDALTDIAMDNVNSTPGLAAGSGLTVATWSRRLGFMIHPVLIGLLGDENEADRLMLELYRDIYSGRLDHLQMFLPKEFFEILEKAIDRCREAGVVAYQIVLKNS